MVRPPYYDRVYPQSRVLVFDPVAETFDVLPVDFGGLTYAAHTSTGDPVMSSGPWTASLHIIDEAGSAPCAIRIPEGQTTPAETWQLDDLTGQPTGGWSPGLTAPCSCGCSTPT